MAHRNFNKGDRVETIDDNIKGIVVRCSGNMVSIICEDGFEQEFKAAELIALSDWQDLIGEPIPDKPLRQNKQGAKQKKRAADQVAEVDLHLHELTDSDRGMSNHEKLKLQLGVARRELEKAISQKKKKIVFIHGRGQGVLRKELHSMLKSLPVDFHDASYMEYGQGATEVILYQNRKGSKGHI